MSYTEVKLIGKNYNHHECGYTAMLTPEQVDKVRLFIAGVVMAGASPGGILQHFEVLSSYSAGKVWVFFMRLKLRNPLMNTYFEFRLVDYNKVQFMGIGGGIRLDTLKEHFVRFLTDYITVSGDSDITYKASHDYISLLIKEEALQ